MIEHRPSTMRESVCPIPGTLPSYRWPSQAGSVPRTCWNCGARLLYGDVPAVRGDETEVICLLCTRAACTLTSDLTPRRMTSAELRALASQETKHGRPIHPDSAPRRLVKILEQADHPIPSLALVAMLETSVDALRKAVASARYAGHQVLWTKLGYTLGVTP